MGQFVGVITLAQIAAPGALTAALVDPAAAGNVEDGAHSYKVTFVAGATETEAGTQSSPVTVADKTTNGKVSLTGIPISSDSGVTARNIYRTEANADPDVAANYKLLTTINNNTATTFTDNVSDASLTTVAPTTNDTVADDFPHSLARSLQDAGMAGGVTGLSFLQIAESGGGNLVISSDSEIAAEADGYPIGDNSNPLILETNGGMNDIISADQLYLFSATAGKQAFVIARTKL